MKTSSKSLFHLVQSLSNEEKNYILRTAIHYRKGGKNYLIQLFKALEKSSLDSYDENNLAAKIPNLPLEKMNCMRPFLAA